MYWELYMEVEVGDVEERDSLHAVLLLEFSVLLHKGVDTVNHLLDKLHLAVAESETIK